MLLPAPDRFPRGVRAGRATPTSVELLTELAASGIWPVPVRWAIAADPALTALLQTGSAIAELDRRWAVRVVVTGLEPAHGYWFRFTALGSRSPLGWTATLPAPDP